MYLSRSEQKTFLAWPSMLRHLMTVLLISLCWSLFFAGQAVANHYFFPQVRAHIERQVDLDMGKEGFVCRGELICAVQHIPTLYRQRQYNQIWFDHHGLKPAAHSLIQVIEQIHLDGLDPADYHLMAVTRLLGLLNLDQFPPDEELAPIWAELDLLLTDALLLLGAHLTGGRINPETLHADWIIPELSVDILAVMNKALARDQLKQTILQLRPTHKDYIGLQSALQRLRQIEIRGGWPVIAEGKTIRPGERRAQIPAIRMRMIIDGDLSMEDDSLNPQFYDDALVAAVESFQRRHGLKPDGIIGRGTRTALNVSLSERIRQIELNLERWRWLPRDLGKRYIAVNTAAYSLAVVENNQKVMGMRVVVGKPARKTPVFSAQLSYMVLNPYWNVPYKLATEDILPKLAKGAEYLINQGIKVFSNWTDDAEVVDPLSVQWDQYRKNRFPFRLRQEPGKKNALGQVKFMFPNKFAVYLHDTPQRSLFDRFQRDFSSGCIRVEHARDLAQYLLSQDGDWSTERLNEVLETGRRQVVRVDTIPVHLLYMTAWVDQNDDIQFRKDIYDRDRDLDLALRRRNGRSVPPQIIPTESLQVRSQIDH